MEQVPICRIEEIPGLGGRFRRIAFLVMPNDGRINAKSEFDGLREKDKRNIQTRFDHWISGGVHKKYFHGWDKNEFNGQYSDCFVFKINVGGQNFRFYGYLCHPDAQNARMQACILIICRTKSTWETDATDLRLVKQIGEMAIVKKAMAEFFARA